MAGKKQCPECGKSIKRARKNKEYESKIREAFPEEYAIRDGDSERFPSKMEAVDMIGYLTKSILSLARARTNLFSKIRGSNIREQAKQVFGIEERMTLIEADCPWDYPNQFYNGSTQGKYKGGSMKDEQLYALPVEGLADDNAALFFWTTLPKLDVALNCIYSWGFEYTTCFFVWTKLRPKEDEVFEFTDVFTGSGSYTRNNAEVCLLGLKGDISKMRLRNTYIPNAVFRVPKINPLLVEQETSIPESYSRSRLLGHHEETDDKFFSHLEASSLFSAIGDHSEKPEETYEKIIAIFGDLPRIILFARRRRPGWYAFGDEVDKFPPTFAMDASLEAGWRERQKKNADFANWIITKIDDFWESREALEIEMQPRQMNQ